MNHGQKIMSAQPTQEWAATEMQQGCIGAKQIRDKPMMDVEYDRLSEALAELDASVAELIGRIQPVCQPAPLAQAAEASSSKAIGGESTPSEMRSKLLGLRLRAQATSSRIAAIRYAIEI